MKGNLLQAIQAFSDVLKGERYVAKKTVELNLAVARIDPADMAEYVRITEEMAQQSADKVIAIEKHRGRGRPRNDEYFRV